MKTITLWLAHATEIETPETVIRFCDPGFAVRWGATESAALAAIKQHVGKPKNYRIGVQREQVAATPDALARFLDDHANQTCRCLDVW